ncbi:putative peptidase S10, serine carboxypeptidase, alpha/Beta hydrolase [Helianthus annuus]|nr:putative peptidase S10, serine carboxypeptidase, alpha/Beta hydrolase [Helianthus annuus]KAJ0633802.1 putative peptidase S10, serine carboxypeptidase, alpha/Beta hydrolase [Helianthus annuus]
MMESKSKMRISLIILVLIVQVHMLPFSQSKSIVKHLPGFLGDLPFTLETGYVGVGKEEKVELFYYFVESQRNPHQDPLLLYLTGGPGTSAILPLFYQIGPLNFEYTNATRSDVKLEVNPYSWTKTANIIFIDLPVGTGFSYAKRWESSKKNSDSLVVTHAYEFIRKWLMDHPTFLNNPLYITGISYMGLIIPRVVSNIYDGIERGVRPELKIKGFLIVNPHTDKFIDFNSRTEFAYRAGLIEDELYEPAKEHCGGKYIYVDPNNTLCLDSLRPIKECLDRINVVYILDPLCNRQDPKQTCRESIYSYSNIWANMKSVRQALSIREGTVNQFQVSNANISSLFGRPDTIYYSHDIFSSLTYYKKLVTKNCHALIINGDHDMTFPYMGTKQWINSLKLGVQSPWKPWFIRTQVAGYEKTYSEAKFSLKYATIKGAGHSVAIYKPEESMVIVETWLASHNSSTS